MEFYKWFIEIVDANLICCLIPIILTLILFELIFKNRYETKKVLNLVRWTIILYTIIIFTFYLIEMYLKLNEFNFMNRTTGPYAWAYWLMLFSALILPFSLLVKKVGTNIRYVLFVAVCMKIGSYLEHFVIFTTSLQRHFMPDNGNNEITGAILNTIGIVFLKGVIIVVLLLGVFELIKKMKK